MVRIRLMPSRTVHCADALAWLQEQPSFAGCSFITSLPDVSELGGMALEAWRNWFFAAASLVMSRLPEDGLAIFYQSDIREGGVWVDKGFLCSRAAAELGLETLFHKIVCRKPAGTITFGRPAYSHLLGFARAARLDMSRGAPDVLPEAGDATWTRGMGAEACRLACRLVLDHTPTRTIVDPFCGHGTVLAVANAMGLDAVGVELNKKRAQRARMLALSDLEATRTPE